MILMRSFSRRGENGMMEERIEICYGKYRCVKCGNDMVSVLETDRDGRFVYREEPLACPKCGDLGEAAFNLLEVINPELADRLKRFFL